MISETFIFTVACIFLLLADDLTRMHGLCGNPAGKQICHVFPANELQYYDFDLQVLNCFAEICASTEMAWTASSVPPNFRLNCSYCIPLDRESHSPNRRT